MEQYQQINEQQNTINVLMKEKQQDTHPKNKMINTPMVSNEYKKQPNTKPQPKPKPNVQNNVTMTVVQKPANNYHKNNDDCCADDDCCNTPGNSDAKIAIECCLCLCQVAAAIADN